MRNTLSIRLPLALALAAALTASPALAQGKGKDKDKDKDRARPELVKRTPAGSTSLRPLYDGSRDVRWEDERYEQRGDPREQGPAFCRNGKGHPKHGWRWCEERGFGRNARYDSRIGAYESRDRRASTRTSDRYETRGVYGSSRGGYDQQHADFHRQLDQRYSEAARSRPLDVRYQLQLRAQKQAEHDRWHAQAGIGHDGSRRD